MRYFFAALMMMAVTGCGSPEGRTSATSKPARTVQPDHSAKAAAGARAARTGDPRARIAEHEEQDPKPSRENPTYARKIQALLDSLDPGIKTYWWKFDEATGSFACSGNQTANGTASASDIARVRSEEWGDADQCIRLTRGGHVNLGDILHWASTQACTILVTYKPGDSTGGWLVGRRNNGPRNSRGWMVDLNARSPRFLFGAQSGTLSATLDVAVQSQNCWCHLAVVRSGDAVSMWHGGVKGRVTKSGTARGSATTTGQPATVGICSDLAAMPFVGNLNDIVIIESALSDKQVESALPNTPMDVLLTGPHDAQTYISCPFIARDSSGRLYCVHWAGSGHYNSDGSIWLQTSTNGGITWTRPAAVLQLPTGHTPVPSAFGCFTFNGTETLVLAYRDYKYGAGTGTLYTVRSTDGGGTWDGQAAPLTSNDRSKLVGADLEANCRFVLKGPTLLLPVDVPGGSGECKYYQSADGAGTWGNPVAIVTASKYCEPNLAILDDGTWLCLIRKDDGAAIKALTSGTGAAGSWSAAADAFSCTPAAPKFIQLPSGRIYVTYRQAATSRCAYRYSDDNGATWSDATEVMYRAGTQQEADWVWDPTNQALILVWSVGTGIVAETICGPIKPTPTRISRTPDSWSACAPEEPQLSTCRVETRFLGDSFSGHAVHGHVVSADRLIPPQSYAMMRRVCWGRAGRVRQSPRSD